MIGSPDAGTSYELRMTEEPSAGRAGDPSAVRRAFLDRVALAVNSSLDIDDVLERLANLALEAVPADRCSVFLLNESGTSLVPCAYVASAKLSALLQRPEYASRPHFRDMAPIDLEEDPSRLEVLRTGRAFSIPDLTSSPLVPREAATQYGARSALVVSLIAVEEPLGVLALDWTRRVRRFHDDELLLVEAIAAYASLAIRNARLYEKLTHKARSLEVLHRLSDLVAGTSSLQTALNQLNELLGPELGIELQSISVGNERLRSAFDVPSPVGVELEALRSWRAVLAKRSVGPRPRAVGDALLVPVIHRSRVQGVIRAKVLRSLEPRDEELLLAIGTACAEVIYKAGLRRDLAESEHRLAIARERERIAQDLHDSVGQLITGLGMQLTNYASQAPDDEWRKRLEGLVDLTVKGSRQVREAIHSLAFLQARRRGLARSLRELAQTFGATSGIEARFQLRGRPFSLAPAKEDALFRAAHEALTNVERHARSSLVSILLTYGTDEVSLAIRDHGVGLGRRNPFKQRAGHFGIGGIQRLLDEVGGELLVANAHPRGVLVEARIRPKRRRPNLGTS